MQRKFVFVDVPSPFATPPQMNETEWLDLHRKGAFGDKKLPPRVKAQLISATSLYASSLRSSDAVKPLLEIMRQVETWRKHTVSLRKSIWKAGTAAEAGLPDWTRWDDHLAQAFVVPPCTETELMFPLALMDRVLRGALSMTSYIRADLRLSAGNSDYRRLWFLWAALVFSILGEAGISVKHPKRKEIQEGPERLLRKLQSKLPAELQIRKAHDSFRKGAVAAYKIRKGNPTAVLTRILARWVQGDFRPTDNQEAKAVLKRFDDFT